MTDTEMIGPNFRMLEKYVIKPPLMQLLKVVGSMPVHTELHTEDIAGLKSLFSAISVHGQFCVPHDISSNSCIM